MIQNIKKISALHAIFLIFTLLQTLTTYNSDSIAISDRTDDFFQELRSNDIDYDKLTALAKKGIDFTDTRHNKTPLIKAVEVLKDNSNGILVIKTLIDQILATNEPALYKQDSSGNTALSIAAQLRKHDFYNLLYRVYTYEQQEIPNKKGISATKYKGLLDRTDLFFKLLKTRLTTISQALFDRLLDLIKKGIQLNIHVGTLQETPLTAAVKALPDDSTGNTIVETLLKEGAYYDNSNITGTSALSIAVQENKPVFAKLLLSYGADQNMQDSDGKSPKDYAQESTNQTILNLFNIHNPLKEAKVTQEKWTAKDNSENVTNYDKKTIINNLLTELSSLSSSSHKDKEKELLNRLKQLIESLTSSELLSLNISDYNNTNLLFKFLKPNLIKYLSPRQITLLSDDNFNKLINSLNQESYRSLTPEQIERIYNRATDDQKQHLNNFISKYPAIIEQKSPFYHNIEKELNSLCKEFYREKAIYSSKNNISRINQKFILLLTQKINSINDIQILKLLEKSLSLDPLVKDSGIIQARIKILTN